MTPFYVEHLCLWVKTAVWDAPRRIYLDIELERLSCINEQKRSSD